MTYQFHEIANIFPIMGDDELATLADDIRANGLRESIKIYDGQILDGRNRYLACHMASVAPTFDEYTGDDPLRYVVSLNLHRRHLNESQRAMCAARIANLPHGGAIYARSDASIDASPTQQDAAEMLNVSRPSVQRARSVLEHGTPEMIAAVDAGEMAVSRAANEVKPHVSHNSGDNEWYTPEHIAKAARQVMGGIDLDPASSETANAIVRASEYYDLEADGLEQVWAGRVFMNPPYSQPAIERFCERLCQHVEAGAVTRAIVLVNNATETAWFQRLAGIAKAICFPRGRVKFWSPGRIAAPLQGQAIVWIDNEGPDNDDSSWFRFETEFGPMGFILWVGQ